MTHVLAYKGCFLTVLTIFSGGVAGLVTCWFKLGGVPVPMFVESAFKAVHGGCIYYSVRKIVPSVDNAVTKSICTNVEPRSFFVQFEGVTSGSSILSPCK